MRVATMATRMVYIGAGFRSLGTLASSSSTSASSLRVSASAFRSTTCLSQAIIPFLPTTCYPHQHQHRKLSTNPKSTIMSAAQTSFLDAFKARRTYYQLNKDIGTVTDDRIEQLVKEAVLHTPSSFNSQSSRLVVLLKEEHIKFWSYVGEILKAIVSEEQWVATKAKVDGFSAGYGTILFYEDSKTVVSLQEAYAAYADKFPQWSEHTSAMHQFVLWVALEAEGLGANLQHYNPLIDQKAQQEWGVPSEWQLKAQLVFGGRAGEAGEKQFKPVEERLFIHGKN